MPSFRRQLLALMRCVALAGAFLVAGCASLPPPPSGMPDVGIPASDQTELGRTAAKLSRSSGGLSSVRPLPQASFALDARLELIRRAEASIDVQTYQLGKDKTGLLILRELRDAARRGVRVRLLLDDFYTAGLDPLLLALANEPRAEVRLFNPFVNGRAHATTRWLDFFTDFRRLNHRMHNKLFIADGAMAIAGGRNLADEYFLRSDAANFIDFELLMAGPVVPQSSRVFDTYWNSDVVYPLQSVFRTSEPPEKIAADFESETDPSHAPPPEAPSDNDILGEPPLGVQLAKGELPWMHAEADAIADSPNKALGTRPPGTQTLASRAFAMMATAKAQVLVVSPYFTPATRAWSAFASAGSADCRSR